jgi:DNA mismatch repair protein MutL
VPNRIQLLSEQVANQIAAGEVIERPASVVKELVENALDAGSTQVEIITRGGGRSLIQITDNGHGMSRDDALLCLERHATSKIRHSQDLATLHSYGFRGEAIPSIASVSKFRLRTREPDSISGTELILNGGKLEGVKDAGLPPGTQIEVRSLFYNLPARRKFLRTEQTESAHVQHQLIVAGLSRPDVGFSITHDDQSTVRWSPNQDLARRVASIYGEEWLKNVVPIAAEGDGLKLFGLIGQPGVSRANRQEELFFINQRPVENKSLHFGLMEGYHNALMRGRYPVCVLFLEMDPAGLDVNIHPAKREVRFHDDFRIRQFVVQAVQNTLRALDAAPLTVALSPEARSTYRPPETFSLAPTPSPAVSHEQLSAPLGFSSSSTVTPPAAPSLLRPPASAEPLPLHLRLLGIVAQLYIIAESPEGLVLIDQHAAHERILFEQMLARLAREEIKSQRLLLPVTLEFPPRESNFLKSQLEALNKVGVGVSLFGAHSFIVDALPPMVKTRDIENFIRTLVVELQEEGGETRTNRRASEEVVAKTVCRHAVKANDKLTLPECEQLLRDLLACDLPYTCPHGRPTMIQLSKADLEKKFGRAD